MTGALPATAQVRWRGLVAAGSGWLRLRRWAASSAAATPVAHQYQSCRDGECERPYCRIWKEAFAEGYEYGFADGLDACPCGRQQ